MHNNPGASALLWIAVTMLFVIAIAGMLAYVVWWYLRNWFAPTTRVEARLLLKRTKTCDITASVNLFDCDDDNYCAVEADAGSRSQYIVIFAFNGRREEFDVPESTFTRLCEGDIGLLSFKGEKFVCFIPNVK